MSASLMRCVALGHEYSDDFLVSRFFVVVMEIGWITTRSTPDVIVRHRIQQSMR